MAEKLPTLPLHIKYVSKNWYKCSKSGAFIHASKIHNYLPEVIEFKNEVIREKRYDLKY